MHVTSQYVRNIYNISEIRVGIYTVSVKKQHSRCTHKFNAHQQTSLIFAVGVAECVRYRMVICYPTSPN